MHCKHCSQSFEISDQDLDFYEKVSPLINGQKFLIPPPQQCPDCRERNRIALRNERKLYQRKCDLCKKEIIAVHAPEKKTKVFCTPCWWSDNWDMEESAQEFDFNRRFFEQFHNLLLKAPLLNLFGKNNVNSDYVNQETDDKNCYLNAGGHFNEDCYYNTYCFSGKNNMDNYWLANSELCYMCLHSENCYNSSYLYFCQNVRDCQLCFDCRDCENCFGSYGLRHKKYHFFNQPLSEEDYKKKVADATKDFTSFEESKRKAYAHFLQFPHRANENQHCENVTGDRLAHSHNLFNAFDAEKLQDCKNIFFAVELKDAHEVASAGWGELIYFCASSMKCYKTYFCSHSADISESLYCYQCFNVKNCFGCVGLHHKEFCILNRQYSKEEYESLVPKILHHMMETQEYGRFFPLNISPFAYNESVAQEYFPRTREEAIAEGVSWHDPHLFNCYEGPKITIPNRIEDVSDEIVKQILTCESCGKNYKIIQQELALYRRLHVPVARHCWECRHRERLSLKPPRKLWQRECAKCKTTVHTAYAPERPEIVYCETCYLKDSY